MAILTQALFTLVGCDLMPLSLTSTWHLLLSYTLLLPGGNV